MVSWGISWILAPQNGQLSSTASMPSLSSPRSAGPLYESMNTMSCARRASSMRLQHAASTSTSEICSLRIGLALSFLLRSSVSTLSTLSASTSAPG